MAAATPILTWARPQDAPAVEALLREAALPISTGGRTMVARQDGAVVACGRLETLADGSIELAGVAVRAALRGTGIGTLLVRRLLAEAPGPVVALALAPGFFVRHGFVELPSVPPALEARARGACASTGFVPMVRAVGKG